MTDLELETLVRVDSSAARGIYEMSSFEIIEVAAKRAINSKASGRKPITELLIVARP